MELKRSTNYSGIIELVFIALVIIGGTILFAAHLILSGDWSVISSPILGVLASSGFLFLIVLCFGVIFTLSYCYGLFWREQTLSAATQGNSRLLATATDQPDQALALQPGETVSLERKSGVGNLLTTSLLMLLLALIVAASGEVIVFALLPVFGHSTLNPFYFPLLYGAPPAVPQPTTMDWITAAFPLTLGLLLIATIPILITEQRYKLIANDQGLTLRRRLRRRGFISWDDIALFIQVGKNRSGNVSESYLLWGREHRLAFYIIRLPAAPAIQKQRGSAWANKIDSYRFEGGFERYAADAQRVLATIAARSHASLQILPTQPALVTRIKQRLPDRLTLDDLNTAPLAGTDLQPKAMNLPAEAAQPTITLKTRLHIGPLLLETVLWLIIIGVLVFVFGQTTFSEILPLPAYWVIIILAICAAFCLAMGFGMAWSRQRRRAPIIIASPESLACKIDQKAALITIPWDEMRAWAIKLSPDHTRPQRTYIVCSERSTLAWTERPDAALAGKGIQGDRHQAYQEQAEHLHCLIAARTGLPLREINSSRTNPTQG